MIFPAMGFWPRFRCQIGFLSHRVGLSPIRKLVTFIPVVLVGTSCLTGWYCSIQGSPLGKTWWLFFPSQQGGGIQLSPRLILLYPAMVMCRVLVLDQWGLPIYFWMATKSNANSLHIWGGPFRASLTNNSGRFPYPALGFLSNNLWLLGATLFVHVGYFHFLFNYIFKLTYETVGLYRIFKIHLQYWLTLPLPHSFPHFPPYSCSFKWLLGKLLF